MSHSKKTKRKSSLHASESEPRTEFETAGNEPPLTLIQEFVIFIRDYRAWWLIPILIALGLLAILVILASTGAAPFIYPIF